MSGRLFSPEEVDFLRENRVGHNAAKLASLFNSHFGRQLSVRQIETACDNRGFRSGNNGCFPKGHVPFNKGMKGLQMGGKETQFKKGHLPHNHMPVGSERINAYGNVDVKIADPNKWRSKASLTWEAAHGTVPPGHVVIVADGNKLNVALENLLLVSRGELAVMNKKGLIGGCREATEAGKLVADIHMKITERQKRSIGCKKSRKPTNKGGLADEQGTEST